NASCGGTNLSCNGGNNGTASATVSGGGSPYSYSWSNGATTSTISGNPAGTYTVTVTDNCSATATCAFIITEPAVALSALCSGTDVSCNGGNNGSASLASSGGTIAYSYLWSTGATTTSLNSR